MDLNQFTQYFDNPKVSVFNRSKKVSFPMRIGPLYPTYWDFCSFGNSHRGTSFHSMRLAPMLAPNFSDLRLQEHAAVVPLRVIMKDYEEKFNYAINVDGASLPHISIGDYHKVLSSMCLAGINPIGSLFDFLGFPVYADLYKLMVSQFSSMKYINQEARELPLDYYPTASADYQNYDSGILANIQYRSYDLYDIQSISNRIQPLNLFSFIIYKTFNLDLTQKIDLGPYLYELGAPTNMEDLVKVSIFKTMQSAMDSYLSFLFGQLLTQFANKIVNVSDKVYTTLPLRAYFRFHYDWNVNGNFVNRDIELERNVYGYEEALLSSANFVIQEPHAPHPATILRQLTCPCNRLWDNDFFTSLLPTSAVDNAISIPANSTVLDLAKLTAIQKLVLKLSYSSRYRDVVWNVFKIKPSDARLQQSSPIYQQTHNIGIGETLQTSESTVTSVQGNMAGRGYSSGKSKGYHIFCEEPCVVLQFASFVPRASYADALHPLIHVDDILDFPIPDMDVLGNQPVYADLLSGNALDSNVVLGYGRQYQEWLYNYNTVHGELKTTLSYWQLTRRFYDTPVINEDFLRIDDHDDFDDIFSMPESMHAYVDFFYNCYVSRHVHRNVRIQI